jgi:two-component system chemotaxis sensor kinase CheA
VPAAKGRVRAVDDAKVDTSEYLGLFLDESRDSLDILNGSLLLLEHDPADQETLATIFRVAHSLKGMSASVGLDAMATLTHRMEDVLAALRDGGATPGAEVIDALFACLDALQAMVDAVVAGDESPVDTSSVLAGLEAAATAVPGSSAPPRTGAPPPRAEAVPQVVRIAPEHLEALVDVAADLAGRRSRLAALSGDPGALRDEVDGLGREVERLAEVVGAIRLTRVEDAFTRFPRLVRDLAQELGKLVELHMDGGGIAIERVVAEGLGEPLTHALRNAVDHGIEFPGDRAAMGKEPVGALHLVARRAAGGVEIEVRDDGRGIDPQALRASAVRDGRMDVGAALALSDEDALQLVFAPGLSTARTITGVSGRGVGMDAVRASVRALGGEVEIASVPGTGCAVTIRLPLAQPSSLS